MTSRITERLMRIFNSHEYEIVLLDGRDLAQIDYQRRYVTGYALNKGDKIEVPVRCSSGDGLLSLTVQSISPQTKGAPKVFADWREIRHSDLPPATSKPLLH